MLPIFLQLLLFVIPALLSVNVNGAKTKASTWIPKQHPYPKVPRGTKTWSYRSAKLGRNDTFADSYYELEKPLNTDPGVIKFIDQQTQLLNDYVKSCKSKDKIAKSIAEAYDFNDYDYLQLITQAPKPFYLYNVKSGKDNRPIWYTCTPSEMDAARKNNLATPPGKKFLNETLLSVNGTVNIQYTFVSPDGQYFAYIASDSNSDVAKIYVRKFTSPLVQAKTFPPGGEGALPDAIPFVDGNSGFVWTKDSTGFFYVQVNDDQGGSNADAGYTVRYHKLGTSYEKDITVVHPDKDGPDGKQNIWFIWSSVDMKWLLVMGLNDNTAHAKAYATIYQGQTISDKMKWIGISPDYDYEIQWIDIIKDIFYFFTDKDAIDGKVVKSKLDWSKARSVSDLSELKDQLPMTDLIPEIKVSKILYSYAFGGDKVLLTYIQNGRYVQRFITLLPESFY
jgi:protease II